MREQRGWTKADLGRMTDSRTPRAIGYYYENTNELSAANQTKLASIYHSSLDLIVGHRIHQRLAEMTYKLKHFDWDKVDPAELKIEINNDVKSKIPYHVKHDRVIFTLPAHIHCLQLPEVQLIDQEQNVKVFLNLEDVHNLTDDIKELTVSRTGQINFTQGVDWRAEVTYGVVNGDKLEQKEAKK